MVANQDTRIADQVWIALAQLTRQTGRDGFRTPEIVEQVAQEFGVVAPGVFPHIANHCLASGRPSPERLRMVTRVSRGSYRLFRPGDNVHPHREGEDKGGTRTKPERSHIPARFHPLLDWYETEYTAGLKRFSRGSKLLQLEPGDSGLSDVSERHDEYLANDYLAEHKKDAGAEAI